MKIAGASQVSTNCVTNIEYQRYQYEVPILLFIVVYATAVIDKRKVGLKKCPWENYER